LKKIIIILGFLISILFFGAPYYTGKVAETETMKLVDRINASAAEYGSTEILSYDRGIRSTSARYKHTSPISFAGVASDFANQDGDIVFRCDSDHGITGIDYGCELEGESTYSKFVEEHLNGEDPISVFGSISMFGGVTQSISLDQVKGVDIDGSTLNLPEALVSISTDADASELYMSGSSEAFEMQGNGETLSVGEMSLEVDFTRVVGSLFIGDMLMKVEHFTTKGALGKTSVKGLSVFSNASEHGETLSSKVLFSADQVSSPGSPFESISDIDVGVDFKGLDKQSVIEYQEFTERLHRDNLAALTNPNEPQTDPTHTAQLMPILEGMLKRGLEINANLNAKFDGKPNKIALDLKLLDSLTIEQLSLFMSKPDDALQKVYLLLDASFDKGLVDSQPMAAALIAGSPLIAADNDNYALDLQLGEKIELNGKAMSFAELQTLVLANMPF
jgi:uncharacterized protein YdgA (DUF945 family)